MNLLAEAMHTADPMISGEFVLKVIGAIFSGVLLLLGGRHIGKKEGETSRDVTVKKPVPTIQIREEAHWATKPELEDHIERTDKRIGEVWDAIQAERGIARTALGRIHERLDAQTKATATLQGCVEEVGKNVNLLLSRALNQKPGTRQ